jgi:hypothetical protein
MRQRMEQGYKNAPTDGGKVQKSANEWRKGTKVRQRMEEGHKNAPTDGGRVKNAPKPLVTKHAFPVVWFHEEPSLCCVLYREISRKKTRPGCRKLSESVKLFPVGQTSCFLCLNVKCTSYRNTVFLNYLHRNNALSAYKLGDVST